MGVLSLILFIAAIILFLLASMGGEPRRWQCLCWGLAMFAAAFFVQSPLLHR